MYEYVPSGLPSNRPLVVVLHGCTQTAASMVNAGWNALADQYQFAVVYPEQQTANNPVRCFNWAGEYGDTANLVRGQGENQSIISMVDTAIAAHASDASKVYVVGFSAGAAFAVVLAATWPEKFAAVAVMSGLPYKCATSVNGAYTCQNPGVTKTAPQWGDLVRGVNTTGPWPRVQIWHGASDTTVAYANEAELVKQWTDVMGIDQTPDETESIGSAATRTAYKSGSTILVESYSIAGMSHATAVGAEGGTACPAVAGSYFVDKHICATLRAGKFFGVVPGGNGSGSGSGSGGPDASPYIAIVSPSTGDTVSGQVTIVVAAGDDIGVTNVELSIDGATVGTDDMAPYQFPWDTVAAGKGTHMLVATAHDSAGHSAMATAMVTIPDGSGSGGGSGGTGPAGPAELPACSLNAGGAGAQGWAPIAMAFVIVIRIGRRRRSIRASR